MNLHDLGAAMLQPLVPALLLAHALLVWALVDIVRSPVRHLTKAVWAAIVLLAVQVGAFSYLVVGRGRGAAAEEVLR